jgi:phage shock protein PspC (stress-responsive transcriptional regulator)
MRKKLYRDPKHSILGGVAAGLSKRFGMGVSIVRILWAASCYFNSFGAILYIILWVCIPKANVYADQLDEIAAPSKRGGCLNVIIILGLIFVVPAIIALIMLMFVFALCGYMNSIGM